MFSVVRTEITMVISVMMGLGLFMAFHIEDTKLSPSSSRKPLTMPQKSRPNPSPFVTTVVTPIDLRTLNPISEYATKSPSFCPDFTNFGLGFDFSARAQKILKSSKIVLNKEENDSFFYLVQKSGLYYPMKVERTSNFTSCFRIFTGFVPHHSWFFPSPNSDLSFCGAPVLLIHMIR
uniref:Uncharacterized protein n=1 Tax=Lactuca sativa TaxID=4236 RepID=A0A9R1XV55_LACSA|nr:hypothetical protein LSAT_V11C100048180 [Lactuca sativa]